MRKTVFTALIIVFTASMIFPALSQDSGDADVSIEVDRKCESTNYGFSLDSNIEGDEGYPLMGTGGTADFTYRPTNRGEMSYSTENISIYRRNQSAWNTTNTSDLGPYEDFTYETLENQTLSDRYLFNSTNFDGDRSVSRLLQPNETVLRAPYWYNLSYDGWPDRPESKEKNTEYIAPTNFTNGIYLAEMNLTYACEVEVDDNTTVLDKSTDTGYSLSNFPEQNYNISDVVRSVFVDGLNVSRVDKSENYIRTVNKTQIRTERFKIVSVQGNGSTPDEVSDTNEEIGRNLDTDADEVSNFTENSSLNNNVNESQNASRSVDSNLTSNSSLDSDAEQSNDATQVEGNNPDQPGETPVPEPEPQPEPEPTPLLSVNIRPLNTTYTTSRGRYAEIGLEINNTGEETLSNLDLEPRFSEGMDWDAQSGTIDSLDVGESVNQSVFVRANASVEPGIYQIPVYASNEENDLASQYVNVEITDEPVAASALSISEAPQDIRFEINNNYSVPVLLENSGANDLENVSLELQNTENCGDYTAEQIESVAAGESASISLNFSTSSNLEECEATIVASSSSGTFAFSEMTVRNVEDKGIVPQEFRVPIVASLWTAMLVIYTVVIKRYGLNSMSVKIPMVILVVGEAFILIYLSSAYYGIFPPGLLPFSSA